MQFVIRAFLVVAVVVFFLPEPGKASVIFKPGEKPRYVAPGEEEISGNAAELFQIGQTAEKKATSNARSEHTKVSLDAIPKISWRPVRFIAALNCRNSSTSTHRHPIHFSSWWKDIPAVRISTNRSRGSFASAKFILTGKN